MCRPTTCSTARARTCCSPFLSRSPRRRWAPRSRCRHWTVARSRCGFRLGPDPVAPSASRAAVCPSARAPVTCSSRPRWPCPRNSRPNSARRWRPWPRPRRNHRERTWGSDVTDGQKRGLYVISVAAELAGVHPQTLRIYERRGLLDPARTVGGSRRYSDRDIERLRRIQDLTSAGLNLAGVKLVMEMEEELRRLQRELDRTRQEAQEAVERTHRQYRRDLVPLKQSPVRYRGGR